MPLNLRAQITPHFTLGELVRSDTAEREGIPNQPDPEAVQRLTDLAAHVLEPLRVALGKPVRVLSGYRSPTLNSRVGGVFGSDHTRGRAADITVPGMANADLAAAIRDSQVQFDQLILEGQRKGEPESGWVHVSYWEGAYRRQVLTMYQGRYLPGLIDFTKEASRG